MLKKITLGGLVACVSQVAALGLALASGASKAGELQKEFFDQIAAEKTDSLLAKMHPQLAAEIDPEVMSELLLAINEQLGKVTDISQTGFRIEQTSDGTLVKSEAKVQFEKGTATSKLVTLDGQLVRFNVNSERLVNWFKVPRETGRYEQVGKRFLEQWLGGQTENAWNMFHPNLKKVITEENLQSMHEIVSTKFGSPKSITATGTRIGENKNAPTLLIDYTVVCEDAELAGEIEIQFEGMKGHLLGFKM